MLATRLGPALTLDGDSTRSIRIGGWALILGALGFLAVFAFLAARFDYPAVLDGSADIVLPKLLATGTAGRAAWAISALLPLIWIPAGVGAYYAGGGWGRRGQQLPPAALDDRVRRCAPEVGEDRGTSGRRKG